MFNILLAKFCSISSEIQIIRIIVLSNLWPYKALDIFFAHGSLNAL